VAGDARVASSAASEAARSEAAGAVLLVPVPAVAVAVVLGGGTGLAEAREEVLLAGIGENSSYAPIAVPPIDHREAALTALQTTDD